MTHLNFTGNKFSSVEEFIEFAKNLSEIENLSELYLAECDLEEESIMALAKLFSQGKFLKLQRLNLTGNKISEEGAKFLESQLLFLPRFEYFNSCDSIEKPGCNLQ